MTTRRVPATRRRRRRRRGRPLSATRRAVRRERRTQVTIVAVMAALIVVVACIITFAPRPAALPDVARVSVDPSAVPPLSVAGFDREQLVNAAVIVDVGAELGLSTRDQAIAVMTAIGESSLRNIDYGDWETSGRTNPDGSPTSSVGLFQQQDWWGSREERMDPATSARLFYRAMLRSVPDREAIAPTLVAHRTQVNDDPDHYARSWDAAVAVVAALAASSAARG